MSIKRKKSKKKQKDERNEKRENDFGSEGIVRTVIMEDVENE